MHQRSEGSFADKLCAGQVLNITVFSKQHTVYDICRVIKSDFYIIN